MDYDKLDKKNMELLLEITTSLFSTLDTNSLFNFITNEVASFTLAKRCSIIKILGNDKALVLSSHESKVPKGLTIDLKKYPEVQKVLMTNTFLAIPDMNTDPILSGVRNSLSNEMGKSILIVPITFADSTAGTILLRIRKDEHFTDDEVTLSYLLAQSSRAAVKNAILHEKLKASESNFKEMVILDPETWLYNKNYFISRLDEEFERAKTYGFEMSLLSIEVTGLDKVKKTHGSENANFIYTDICLKIKNNIRKSDVAAHYGGSHITLILPHTSKDNAAKKAHKLKRVIDACDFSNLTNEKISLIIGVASYPNESVASSYRLYDSADKAMNMAKTSSPDNIATV